MKSVVILGSTGSIGENALRVIAAQPDRIRVTGLAVHRQAARALEQAAAFGVARVAVADPAQADWARRQAPPGVTVLAGPEGVLELAAGGTADLVVCALVGMAGLRPVMAALEAGRDVALATKEVLVAAGAQVMAARARAGVKLVPIDSEHSALFQCLLSTAALPACVRPAAAPAGQCAETRVRRLLLTASGGPFANRPEVDFERVTVSEALKHPRWSMGRKVTIDSASMMNKGLELLEARWLFDVPVDRMGVLVHPESIVHSLVEFADGAMLAQLAPPDMRFAIHYALNWPARLPCDLPTLDLARLGSLHFADPDEQRFPCLRLARQAAAAGGASPAVLNAANEVAVEAFLDGRLAFAGIWHTVDAVLQAHDGAQPGGLDGIFAADDWARTAAARRIGRDAAGGPAGRS